MLFKNTNSNNSRLSQSVRKLNKSELKGAKPIGQKTGNIKTQDEYSKFGSFYKDQKGYLRFKKSESSQSNNGSEKSTKSKGAEIIEPVSSVRFENASLKSFKQYETDDQNSDKR